MRYIRPVGRAGPTTDIGGSGQKDSSIGFALMAELPDGVVTFLFTDVEGSTGLWEEAPDSMMAALIQHDRVIDEAVSANNGISVKPRGEGDSRFVVFRSAVDALIASAEMQRRLAEVDWVTPRPLQVRASLHTGAADLQLGDYYGSAVNRAARLRAIAHGGQTVMSGSTWELVRDQLPDDVTVTDMGLHRLKDLTRPEHVFQVNVEGLEDAFPHLLSLDAIPNNLPEQLTEFIGRRAELAEAERLLGETRLLTILAPGGSGKTRLAIQTAADLIADYPDGVFFVPLADIDNSGDIVQAVAESLGLGLSSDEDPQTQLLKYLTNRQQLLVFDNFEHLAEGVTVVAEILRSAPGCKILATSQARLNLTGETVLTLEGLETTWDGPEEALHTSGVRLFIDGAKRTNPAVQLEPEDLDYLAEILRLTEGMPLGILLAAAWADMLSIGEIATEIAKNIDFLESDLGDIADRHRSIRGVFDHTWKLLTDEERSTFAALSVFRRGFTREAAENVGGASLRSLANLANKSLVTPSPATGRYTVHELLRRFAEAELQTDSDQHRKVLDAHAAYYSRMAADAFALIHRGDQPRMLTIIEEDIDNIRLAWQHCLSTGNAAGIRQIVTSVWIIYEIRGWYQAALALLEEALDELNRDAADKTSIVARSLTNAVHAWFLTLLGRQDEGAVAAGKAAEILRSSSDAEARWLTLHCWLVCLLYQGEYEQIGIVSAEALDVTKEVEGLFSSAAIMNFRTVARLLSNDLAGAKELFETMEAYRQLDEHYFMGWHLFQQASVAHAEGRHQDAIDLAGRVVQRAGEIGYLRVRHYALNLLGRARSATGDLEGAEAAFIEALATAEQVSMVREMLGVITRVAQLRAATNKAQAVEMLATVLANPASSGTGLLETTSISDNATTTLGDLKMSMKEVAYSDAYTAGNARPYDIVAKELIDSLPRNT